MQSLFSTNAVLILLYHSNSIVIFMQMFACYSRCSQSVAAYKNFITFWKVTNEDVIEIINGNMCEEMSNISGEKLKFHFHYFLSNSEKSKSEVTRYARDTPLHMAVRKNQLAMVEILLSKGVNVSSKQTMTPFFIPLFAPTFWFLHQFFAFFLFFYFFTPIFCFFYFFTFLHQFFFTVLHQFFIFGVLNWCRQKQIKKMNVHNLAHLNYFLMTSFISF